MRAIVGDLRRMTLIRLTSYALIAAGILTIVADLQHAAPGFMDPNTKFSDHVQTPLWLVHGVLHIAANTLLLLSLLGLLTLHEGLLGPIGRGAFLAAFVLVSVYLGVSYVMTLAAPQMPASVIDEPATGAIAVAFAAYPLSALALLTCGITMTRAAVLPRWTTITFAIGAILVPVTEVLSSIVHLPVTGALVLGVALVGIGFAVRRPGTPDASRPAGARSQGAEQP